MWFTLAAQPRLRQPDRDCGNPAATSPNSAGSGASEVASAPKEDNTVKIGIGLPNPVPGTPGRNLVEWAQRAERYGFSGLATIDRIAYPNYDSLLTLAAAAGATTRIELMTNILLAPVYPPVPLAKSTASLDQLSGGRLTLGVAAGGRPDDFTVTGRDFEARGAVFDESLDLLHRAWRGEAVSGSGSAVSPTPVRDGRIPIMVGGANERTIRRIVRWGEGWTVGGSGAQMAGPFADRVRAAWSAAGRAGQPRLAALSYFSLGADVEEESRGYLRHYYGFLGPFADNIADSALRTPEAIKEAVAAYQEIGFTELYLDPTSFRVDQVDRLAEVVL
jgi:alkanesulfonate monooxygenase SsuD/methylene tetrahydromethanopterin reductase-like flavin-dependent oxidoreductase (luciferase family)